MDITIIIVDDNEHVINTIVTFLKKNLENVIIDSSTDPKKAYAIIKEGKLYNIIVTDNIMPNWDGIQFIDEIYKIYKPYTILYSTMFNKSKELDKYINFFDYCVEKFPGSEPELLNAILELIERVEKGEEKILIERKIDNVLNEMQCSVKDKMSMKGFIRTIIYNDNVEDMTYEKLAEKMDKTQTGIYKKIVNIIERTYNAKTFENVLGIKEKPTGRNFMKKIIELIFNDEKKNEHIKKKVSNDK